jgi:hypothetical protein
VPAEPSAKHGVVDRITEGWAVVLVGDEEVEHHLPAQALPPEAAEGSVLIVRERDGDLEVIGVDAAGTDVRRQEVEQRLHRLRTQRKGGRF